MIVAGLAVSRGDDRRRAAARRTRALCVGVAVLCVTVVTGCGGRANQEPPPVLGEFLHKSYTVLSQQRLDLVPGEPAADVVVSSGPGSRPAAPVAGGTGDVQVLTYDPQAKRWVLSFDAANRADQDTDLPGDPLLDQSHPIDHVGAAPVWFSGANRPSLAVWGLDAFTNHPSYNVGAISFGKGTSTVNWADTGRDAGSEGLAKPAVVGTGRHQELRLTADYLTSQDAACCPVRKFTRMISMGSGTVRVVHDDRPYLGIYASPTSRQGARVLRVDPRSPASGRLMPGDVILSVGNQRSLDPASASLPDPLLEQVAQHRAGATALFNVRRGASTVTVPIRLSSILDPSWSALPPKQGHLGITVNDKMQIIDGSEDSPLLNFGVQADDTLVSINGYPLHGTSDLPEAMWGTGGEKIRLTYKDTKGILHSIQVTPLPGEASGGTALTVDHM